MLSKQPPKSSPQRPQMSPTKYSFKRHQELQHKPTASPVFHRYRAPLPAPTALTGLAQPDQAPVSGAWGQAGLPLSLQGSHPGACSHHSTAPALTAMASSPFLQLLHLRSPHGHRRSCAFFWEPVKERGLTSSSERGRRGTGCRGGAADSISSAGEGGDCLKQVLPLSLSARYEQGSLISLRCRED